MITVGLFLALVAALLHVYIFYLESMAWTSERARSTFGMSAQAAESTKEMAFNQGFYNLFLALAIVVGVVFYAAGQPLIAATLVFVGTASMLGAATALFLSSPDKRSAALKQGTIPALSIIALVVGLAL